MKRPASVKEEEAAEATVPKIDGSVGASPSAASVPLRRINLAAGRLPGHNADDTWLNWPEWGEEGQYYTPAEALKMKVMVKSEVKAEVPAISASEL